MHLIHRYDLLNGVALVPNSSPIGSTHVLRLLNSQLDIKHVLAGIGFKHLHFSYETRQATRLHLLSIALRSLLCWCFLLRNQGILRTTMMKYPRCMEHPQLYNFLIFLNYGNLQTEMHIQIWSIRNLLKMVVVEPPFVVSK